MTHQELSSLEEGKDSGKKKEFRVYLEDTGFIGMYVWDEQKERMIPHKIMYRKDTDKA